MNPGQLNGACPWHPGTLCTLSTLGTLGTLAP
jgi:hypothetical protein